MTGALPSVVEIAEGLVRERGQHLPFLVDVDNVLVDFTTALLEHTRRVEAHDVRPADIVDWDIFARLPPGPRRRAMMICDFNLGDFWDRLPVMDGAQEGVDRLRGLGLDVVFVTSPWDCRDWLGARAKLLKQHFGVRGLDEIVVTRRKELVRGLALVDDRPSHCEDWHRVWGHAERGTAILFPGTHNRSAEPFGAVHTRGWR